MTNQNDLGAYMHPCEACNGTGTEDFEWGKRYCSQCEGTGIEPEPPEADDAAAYQAMADDPTVDQAAWRELADKAKAEMSGNLRCSICGAEARWRVCPRCKGAGCTSEDCPCICCDGEGGEWVCDCDEEKP